MTVTPTMLATMVSLFAAFAAGLAWQQHARGLSPARVDAPRRRRRPF